MAEDKPVEQAEQKVETTAEEKTTNTVDTPETQPEETGDEKKEAKKEETQPSEEDIVKEYFKKKGKEVENLDDLFKEPEVREVNAFEDLMDDDDKSYFAAKKENPSLTRQQYNDLQKDYDSISALELSRERVRAESGIKLTDAQIDEYLQDELKIDLEELSARDEIKLASYAKKIRDEKKAQQAQFKKPVEKKQPDEKPEYVKLNNGSVMLKKEYEALQTNRQQHIEQAKEAVNSVTPSVFKVSIDDNGTKKELAYEYEYSDEDKQSMLADVSDVDKVMNEEYRSKDGFNHKQFDEDMFWRKPKNREKAITSIIHKARAEAIEEVLKSRGNVNFESRSNLPKNKEGKRIVPLSEIYQR